MGDGAADSRIDGDDAGGAAALHPGEGADRGVFTLNYQHAERALVVVPMDQWTRITEKAIRFALKLSEQVQAVHVVDGENEDWAEV